jgi:hypothetical protein
MPGPLTRVFLLKLECFSRKLAPFQVHRKLTDEVQFWPADSQGRRVNSSGCPRGVLRGIKLGFMIVRGLGRRRPPQSRGSDQRLLRGLNVTVIVPKNSTNLTIRDIKYPPFCFVWNARVISRVFLLKLECFSRKLASFQVHRKLTESVSVWVRESHGNGCHYAGHSLFGCANVESRLSCALESTPLSRARSKRGR